VLIVVTQDFPRRMPASPMPPITRSTVHLATLIPSRFSWRQTFREP
jgi:hypothetical protein